MNNEIKGIICDAKNCKFNSHEKYCTAGHIKVGDPTATSSSDTNCQTFECCDNCECR